MVAFDSENTLKMAYEHYENGDYYQSRQLLVNEDNSIPLADFYLYESYLAREELGIKKSQKYLYQALDQLASKNSSTAYEISLNLAFDAYLQKDLTALSHALIQSRHYTKSEDPWLYFFQGLLAYLKENYSDALTFWKLSGTKQWLSPWMRTSFQKHFSEEEMCLKFLHAEIESGEVLETRKKLQDLLNKYRCTYQDDIRYLIGLSILKEAHHYPLTQRSPFFEKAWEYLRDIPNNNSFVLKEKTRVAKFFEKQVLQEVVQQNFSTLPICAAALEKWQSVDELQSFCQEIAQFFKALILTDHLAEASLAINEFEKSLPEGLIKEQIALNMHQQMHQILSMENIELLDAYWELSKDFLVSQNISFPIFSQAILNKLFETIEQEDKSFTNSQAYLSFLQTYENDPHRRYDLAKQMIQKAISFWLEKRQSLKAIELIKLAKQLPDISEHGLLQDDIEQAVVYIHRNIHLEDLVEDFSNLQLAIAQLHLFHLNLFEEQDISNQLADAQYQFHQGHLSLASKKIEWVLKNNPEDYIARKIAALIAFEEGRYAEIQQHQKYLNPSDKDLKDLFAFLASFNSPSFSPEPSENVKLKLAQTFLIRSQPEKALFWLDKLVTKDDEALLGYYVAAFQNKAWEKVLDLYCQLDFRHAHKSVLQAMCIQACIAKNQLEKADLLFNQLISNRHGDDETKIHSSLEKHLQHFNVDAFAAHYFLHIKKDPQDALKALKNSSSLPKELLLQRAELAFQSKDYYSSILDLRAYLQFEDSASREKALNLMAQNYFVLGHYEDCIIYYKKLMELTPQNRYLEKTYEQALTAVGCRSSILALATPTIAPFESKRRSGHVANTQDLTESITLKLLEVKQWVSQGLLQHPYSEKFLSAYAILKNMTEQYPYFSEGWFLKGQILSGMQFHEAAKVSYAKAIETCPSHIEAYKNLASLYLLENDFYNASFYLKRSLELSPHDKALWVRLGKAYESLNQFEEALTAWHQALLLDPHSNEFYIKIAHLTQCILNERVSYCMTNW